MRYVMFEKERDVQVRLVHLVSGWRMVGEVGGGAIRWESNLFLMVLELARVGALWRELVLAVDANGRAGLVGRTLGDPLQLLTLKNESI